MSGNRTTHLRFFRPTRTDRLRYHPICRKCTNRTSPECPKHPMHTITLHSRIKFSRLDSNQRPFVYQTNALNHLSYVRMLEPLLGIEPRTIDYKSIVIPFNYRGLLHACKNSNPDQIFWRDLCYHYTTDAYKSDPGGTRTHDPRIKSAML